MAIQRHKNKGATYQFDETNNIIDGDIPIVDKWAKDTIAAYRQTKRTKKALTKQAINQMDTEEEGKTNQLVENAKRNDSLLSLSTILKKRHGHD